MPNADLCEHILLLGEIDEGVIDDTEGNLLPQNHTEVWAA